MINILIADDNIYYAKTLMNIINSSINNVKVVNIAIDGRETIEQLNNNNNIDVALLDLKMPIISGIDVLHQLNDKRKGELERSIIIISGESKMIAEVRDDETIYNCINKSCNMTDIIEKVEDLVSFKEKIKSSNQLKDRIRNELRNLGYNFCHKGTIYLIDAISLVYNKKMEDDLNLKKDIYPTISNKYNKTVYSIKSDIIKATDYMAKFCDKAKRNEYFSFYDNVKPTVKLVIYTILNKINK